MMNNLREKLIRSLSMFLVMFCLIGAGIFISASKASAGAPAEIRDCVVMVAESLRDVGTKNYQDGWTGSGFFVGNAGENPQYLVTNHHVIQHYLAAQEGKKGRYICYNQWTGQIYFYFDKAVIRVYFDENDFVEAYPVAYNEKSDVAVLRIEEATDKRKPLSVAAPTDDMVGDAVYAFGFPGLSDNDYKDAVSKRSKKDISVTSGLISRLVTQSGTGVREVQTDTEFWSGNSGGPLVTEDGVAIGITANYIRSNGKEMRYAVSMAEVLPLLNNNSVPYTSDGITDNGGSDEKNQGTGDDSSSENASSSDTGSGNDQNVTSAPNENTSSEVSSEEKSGLSTPVIIGIAAGVLVVIILIVVIVVLASKGKKNNSGGGNYGGNRSPVPPQPQGGMQIPPQPAPQGQMGAGGMVSVQGVSGMVAGRTYVPGPDGRITFGRQPACQVVFGSTDKNISGNHCVVYRQNGGIVLMDTGSTNGTFLENGTRLQANVAYPLNPGERFYLVNQNYMFMVK